MDKKTFSRFVNHLEGFTQRIIEHYPNTKDFIEQEKRDMLEKFPQLGQKTCPPPKQGFEMVKDTLLRSINTERQKCYQAVDELVHEFHELKMNIEIYKQVFFNDYSG